MADLRLCWSHIPHCWKSHIDNFLSGEMIVNNVKNQFYVTSIVLVILGIDMLVLPNQPRHEISNNVVF